jgi:hypothetical protein
VSSQRIPWPYAAALPAIWFSHIALTYAAVGLQCHHDLLGADANVRWLQLGLTALAAAALVGCALRVWRALHASGEEAHRHFALGTTLLAANLLVYLAWSLGPVFTVSQPCHP